MATTITSNLEALRGAKAIAEFLYGDATEQKKVYHLAERGEIPVFRLGAIICARKSTLLQWIETQERNQRKLQPDTRRRPSPRA